MAGHIGKPGTGANSITGQCNAMGSRLFSNTTSLLGSHDFTNPAHREKIASVLEMPVERIPREPSWAYDQILEGIDSGAIRALWIIATNPAHSWIRQGKVRERLAKLDFLVVQDMYHSTETAQLADLILPAAAWGEKEGTFINSERRIGRVCRVNEPPGQARPDFEIIRTLAKAWGCGEWIGRWSSPEAVFRLLRQCGKGQPCDISGIEGYAMLERRGGVQWPLPEAASGAEVASDRRLFEDGRFFHSDGRARFCFDESQALPEPVDEEYPLVLLTRRGSSAQWHTETRTSKSSVLRKLYPQALGVTMHPDDAGKLGIVSGELVRVLSRWHRLTFEAVDPHSRQPAYKACAVAVRKL